MKGKQFEKGRVRAFFMLLCFIITMIILVIYSTKYFIALLAPIFWLCIRLTAMSKEQTYMADVICNVDIAEYGLKIQLHSKQPRLCGKYDMDYRLIQKFQVDSSGKVNIMFPVHKKKSQVLSFYALQTDIDFWLNEKARYNNIASKA